MATAASRFRSDESTSLDQSRLLTEAVGVAPSASARGPTAHEQRPGHRVARHCGTLSFVKICRAFARSVGLFRPGVVYRGDRVSSGECDPWLRITPGSPPRRRAAAPRRKVVNTRMRPPDMPICTKRLLHIRIGSLHVGRTSPACDPVDGPTRLSSPVVWGPSSSPCPVALALSRP
jgi:hypothetical protein